MMFADGDPRLSLTVPLDPRVHFALVCGAKSCPPIRIFRTRNLERGLLAAARNFCDQEVAVDQAGRITMSKIFDWFSQVRPGSHRERMSWDDSLRREGAQQHRAVSA